jgi:RNA polymerase sigma factor (sigma-70 family)
MAMFIPLLQRERSIDDFIDKDEGCRLAALLADQGTASQEEEIYQKEIRRLVLRAFGKLDDRERHIIRNRFGMLGGKELTLEEIGRSLNLSRERVRQLEREAKNKLRSNLIEHQANVRFSLA